MKFNAFFILILTFLATACTPPASVDSETLAVLHKEYLSQETAQKTLAFDGKTDVYIDYSSGMYEAIFAGMETLTNDLFTMVKNSNTTYYRVGAKTPYSIDIEEKANIPTNPSNYKEQKSILDAPVNMLVKNGRQAVYLTDFELVKASQKKYEVKTCEGKLIKTQININAWAVEQFEAWLGAGNEVDIYALNFDRKNIFTKKDQSQFLYVILFTPKAAIGKENSLQKRFKDKFGSRLSDKLYHFNFNTLQSFRIQTKEYNKEQGGLNENLYLEEDFQKFSNKAEFYHIQYKTIQDYLLDDPDLEDKRMLQKLYFDAEVANFKDIQMGIKAYKLNEVYQSYEDFLMNQDEPVEYEIDPETGDSTLISGNPNAKFSAGTPKEVKNVFEAVINKSNQEIGIKLHQDYYGPETAEGELYRIDVVFEGASFAEAEQMSKVLQWKDERCFMVRSLYASLQEAMKRNEKRIGGKVLYSYYVYIK